MNKIVREHYPASLLPDELRGEIAASASVKVTVEEEARRPLSREELRQLLAEARDRTEGISIEEAVARVRVLRDEWDD